MTRILVIEDSKDLRDDIVAMLTLEGYEVFGAENGLEGVDLARKMIPDLIVCDIMMPELDGYGVLEALRKDPHTSTIPFIFLTAKTERVSVRHGMVLGADDYLTKPFMVRELMDSIESQLAKRAELRETANRHLEELRKNIVTALPHELRTPLNTIIGFSDMLMGEAHRIKPDQVAEWAGHINKAAHRLYHLTENYLYFVRVQVAEYTPEILEEMRSGSVEFANQFIEAHVMQMVLRDGRDADINLKLTETDDLAISQHDLLKIVDELMSNAIKFSERGTPLWVHSEVRDGYYWLMIDDAGRGIDADQAENIGAYMQFERWFYEQQGIGLGLVIVKRLMELYHGSLKLERLSPQGTRATVGLPLRS